MRTSFSTPFIFHGDLNEDTMSSSSLVSKKPVEKTTTPQPPVAVPQPHSVAPPPPVTQRYSLAPPPPVTQATQTHMMYEPAPPVAPSYTTYEPAGQFHPVAGGDESLLKEVREIKDVVCRLCNVVVVCGVSLIVLVAILILGKRK